MHIAHTGCPRFTQTFTSPMVHTIGSPRLFSNFHHTLTSPRPSYLHLTQTSNHTIISPRPSYPHLTQSQKFKVPNSAMIQSSVGLGEGSLGQLGTHNRSKHIFMEGECLLPQGQAQASIDLVRLGQVMIGNIILHLRSFSCQYFSLDTMTDCTGDQISILYVMNIQVHFRLGTNPV